MKKRWESRRSVIFLWEKNPPYKAIWSWRKQDFRPKMRFKEAKMNFLTKS